MRLIRISWIINAEGWVICRSLRLFIVNLMYNNVCWLNTWHIKENLISGALKIDFTWGSNVLTVLRREIICNDAMREGHLSSKCYHWFHDYFHKGFHVYGSHCRPDNNSYAGLPSPPPSQPVPIFTSAIGETLWSLQYLAEEQDAMLQR